MDTDSRRKKFGRQTYGSLVIFMGLAVSQWILVCLVESGRRIFRDFEVICSATFVLAGLCFTVFCFNQGVRNHRVYSWVVAFVIVELEIFSMYVLAARTWVPDLLAFFFFCTLLMIVALVVGCHLSFSMIMLHAQTINGDRYIQMRLKDFILAALLVFHEFLLTYALTFYWQIHYSYFTSADFFWMSTSTPNTRGTTPEYPEYGDYDKNTSDDDWSPKNETDYDWLLDNWDTIAAESLVK
ncbi:uncharacterized protein LOC117140086 isoform X3 [Drosophila mauritiana]|uniref:Uncharacterized protein LOC117140086 isoform X3 n=1 Tax=Drosophila mauritiana TaxID=7226 RepID=A0A6P8JQI6_DROMA|nr:uncharacterized protein LOC117140086 isoform X3 [Drosophila mauritiana]